MAFLAALVMGLLLAASGGGVVTAAGAASVAAADDADLDGVSDQSDNCLYAYNPDQEDADLDVIGDRCDEPPDPPGTDHRLVVYPRDAEGGPLIGGCVVFTQYDGYGVAEAPVNTCGYADEGRRNRSYQDWVFAPEATRVDVEILTPAGCGGGGSTLTFSFTAGAGDYVDPCVDLTLEKQATNELVAAGERFSYFLAVENLESTNAEFQLTDKLPPELTYVSAAGAQCGSADKIVTCSGELGADARAVVELVVEAPSNGGTLVNEAEVASETPDFDPWNDAAWLETRVGTGADLVLASSADEAAVGEAVHFWISVWNDGPHEAQGVVVEDTLPDGVDFVSATPSVGSCASPEDRDLTCSLGAVPPGEIVEIEVVTSGVVEGALTNRASATSSGPADPDLGNNADAHIVVVGNPPLADLAVYQDAIDDVVGAGERFSYHLLVENAGTGDAGLVRLTDTLPVGVKYVSSEGLPCSEAGGTVTCTVAGLEPGGTAEVEVVVEAPVAAAAFVNRVDVTADTPDPDQSNNTASLETQVGAGADVSLAKYADPAGPGEPVHFWISVWNDGPQSAGDVAVEDILPDGASLLSATPSAGSCSSPAGPRLTCSLGTIAPFAGVDVEVVVSGISEGLLTNTASVTTSGPADPDLNNNRDTHTAVIGDPPLADIAVFNDGPAYGTVGTSLVYGVAVVNVGPQTAQDVRLTDRLAAGSAFVSAIRDDGGSCTHLAGVVTCQLGDVDQDEAISVEITVRAESPGSLTNLAEVAAVGGPGDPEPRSNSAAVATEVPGAPVPPPPPSDPSPPPPPADPPAPPPVPPSPPSSPPTSPPSAPTPKPKVAPKKLTICHNGRTKKVTKKQLLVLRKQVAKANKKKGVKKKQTVKLGACKKPKKKR